MPGAFPLHQTVGQALRIVMPLGTDWTISDRQVEEALNASDSSTIRALWRRPPDLPSDVFAAAGYLCKIGGVVPFFNPSPEPQADVPRQSFFLTEQERAALRQAAEQWRNGVVPGGGDALPDAKAVFDVPDLVVEYWHRLTDCWDAPVTPGVYDARNVGAPDWWKAAIALITIADLACEDLFNTRQPPLQHHADVSEMVRWIVTLYHHERVESPDDGRDARGSQAKLRPPATYSRMADSSIVCVQPKARVSSVGATLRNLTHNLALLPGRGEVRCYWETPMNATPSEDLATLDVLLIPEPRRLDARNFRPGPQTRPECENTDASWQFFDLQQNWINDDGRRLSFQRECLDLLTAAREQSRAVNGIILPEYALDYELFDELCSILKAREPQLEFVIAGASDNSEGEKGNHVLTRTWYVDADATPDHDGAISSDMPTREMVSGLKSLTNSRSKHHRWRMDRSQIAAYALGAYLKPSIANWWEETSLGRRELHFQRFRQSSVMSVLICEELARSDPCHEILRAVAPNLIVALLLDGPQLPHRWPAQYASNLANDPGAAVLTFTSYGLIERSNQQGNFPPAHTIAYWKDDSGQTKELKMPDGTGMRGVLLSLWSEAATVQTMQGDARKVRAWRYFNSYPVRVSQN